MNMKGIPKFNEMAFAAREMEAAHDAIDRIEVTFGYALPRVGQTPAQRLDLFMKHVNGDLWPRLQRIHALAKERNIAP